MGSEKKIVGVFHTEQEAIQAIEGLKRQGYKTEEISVIAKDRDDIAGVTDETGSAAAEGAVTGATTGGVLGGVTGLLLGIGALAIPGIGPIIAAGPIAATLTGAAVGAGTGGLIGMGIPEEEAARYTDYVRDGNILVLVNSNSERDHFAYDTFRANNSLTYGINQNTDSDTYRTH